MAEIEGQAKINFSTDIDLRALSTEVLKRLRVIPIGKRVLVPTDEGDDRFIGITAKKEDERPEVEGETNLKGGYYIEEVGKATKGKIGRYSTIGKIILEKGEVNHLNPNQIFLAAKLDITTPRDLVDQVLKERSK